MKCRGVTQNERNNIGTSSKNLYKLQIKTGYWWSLSHSICSLKISITFALHIVYCSKLNTLIGSLFIWFVYAISVCAICIQITKIHLLCGGFFLRFELFFVYILCIAQSWALNQIVRNVKNFICFTFSKFHSMLIFFFFFYSFLS